MVTALKNNLLNLFVISVLIIPSSVLGHGGGVKHTHDSQVTESKQKQVEYHIEAARFITYELMDHLEILKDTGNLPKGLAAYFAYSAPKTILIEVEHLKDDKKGLEFIKGQINTKIEALVKKHKIKKKAYKTKWTINPQG